MAVTAAGCGGDAGAGKKKYDELSPSPVLSKKEFIRRGDQICADFAKVEGELEGRFQQQLTVEEAGQNTVELANRADASLDDLAALGTPRKGAQEIERYIKKSREQIDRIRNIGNELEDGDQAAAEQMQQTGTERGPELRKMAQDYGFRICGTTVE